MGDPQVGDVLGGKYEVEGVLGRGGMGVVVAARHRDLGQRVAIKCLLPHALENRDVVERFAREARAAAQIQGEHVARVIDVGRFDDGTPYMVMEHLRGHDLSDELLKRGPLPIAEAVRFVLEATEAIAQAHALRIVHRDLKPANLFLAETPGRPPIVKVLDFGISKVVEPNADSLTKTASVMGTPFYMSPEQLLSAKNVDERTDIWALGVILYELLAGRPPFNGESVPEIVAGILQNQAAPLRNFRPDVPPSLEAVIGRCLQSKAADRYGNVAMLAFDLAQHTEATGRDSAVAIARVLGANLPAGYTTDPSGRSSALPPVSGVAATTSAGSAGAPAPAVATAHQLAISSAGQTTSSTSSRLPLVIGGAGAALVAAVVVGVLAIKSNPPSKAAASVADTTATTASAPSLAAPPSITATTASLAPLPAADPSSAAAVAASAPSPHPAPGGAALPNPPRGTPRGAPGPTPARSAPSAPPAPAPTPAPAPPPPPQPTATPHNPLDLQLKQ